MTTGTMRYPIGIQTFERLRRDGYVYVDKTDLVWKLANTGTYAFLSRPRRFGKSLLTTTLKSYFEGKRELFEGLKIMQLENEWQQYPVLHVDLSTAKGQDGPDRLRDRLNSMMSDISKDFGIALDADKFTPGAKFNSIIKSAYEHTGKQVVVLIDEYDAPLLEVLHEDTNLGSMRKVMQEFFQTLKASEAMIRFCFITGITKFSQLSIFSTLNNITNISMDPRYATICGITDKEMHNNLDEGVVLLADTYRCSKEEMYDKLRTYYDGYHFAKNSEGVYNPFSLLSAMMKEELDYYWFSSGTPLFLIEQMKRFKTDITSLDRIEALSTAFDQPTENMQDALPLLYQSGYLTIKDYEFASNTYTLSIPNQEVRVGFAQNLIYAYSNIRANDVQIGFALKFWRALQAKDLDLAMSELKAFLAGIPYVEGFKEKLKDVPTREGFYEYTLYLIFSMLNTFVRTQVKCHGGDIDMVVFMPDTTYVIEFKVKDTAETALRQIEEKGYAKPYQTEGRAVVKVGVSFDTDSWTVKEYLISRA